MSNAPSHPADAESQIAAADDVKRRLLTVPDDIQDEATRVFQAQGAVAADEYLKAYESASAGDQDRFRTAAKANGDAAGDAFAESTKAKIGSALGAYSPVIKVGIDTTTWDNWNPKSKTGIVNADTGTRAAGAAQTKGGAFWR